jgi:hypothetical protein
VPTKSSHRCPVEVGDVLVFILVDKVEIAPNKPVACTLRSNTMDFLQEHNLGIASLGPYTQVSHHGTPEGELNWTEELKESTLEFSTTPILDHQAKMIPPLAPTAGRYTKLLSKSTPRKDRMARRVGFLKTHHINIHRGNQVSNKHLPRRGIQSSHVLEENASRIHGQTEGNDHYKVCSTFLRHHPLEEGC